MNIPKINFDFLKTLRILYVEDELDKYIHVIETFKAIFKEVFTAKNGQEGLELFLQNKDLIDVVLSDYQMPVKNGMQMLEGIRNVNHDVPFLFLSANLENSILLRSIELGVSYFAPKPIDVRNLLIYVFKATEVNYKRNLLQIKNKELENNCKIVDKYVIYSKTDLNGSIIKVSSAFCEVSGYTKEELIGNNHSLIKHPKRNENKKENLWNTLKSNQPWMGVFKNRKKDGKTYWLQSFIEPIFSPLSGEKVGYKNISIDITNAKALKKINRNLQKKIDKAVELNIAQYNARQEEQLNNIKLSSIGSLAAGITHEINTPLTYIKGNFEMMKYDIDDIQGNSPIKEIIIDNYKRIYDGIIRISNIVEAMRELASVVRDDLKEKTNIYHSLITSLTIIHNKSKQISRIYLNDRLFDIGIAEENLREYKAIVNKQKIEQVWIIILNNALDELVKLDDYEERKISISIYSREDVIEIFFKDNGGGISDEIIDTIFDPFVSMKTSNGIGVGLNIAKKIIESNNGTIEAYNEKYEDRVEAVFKVTFHKVKSIESSKIMA
jgi:PAS domain S-box-containing protein